MKLHFMKDDALVYFKNNIEKHQDKYLEKTNDWIIQAYQDYKGTDESPFVEFKLEVKDFEMDMSEEKSSVTDYNNIKILYETLKKLSDTQASDERLWVGLAHSELYDYMQYRCNLKEEVSAQKIRGNFFFAHGQKRSLIMHTLSRLWWAGRQVYDETSQDNYKALEYMKVDFPTKVLSLFSSNFTNNPTICQSILLAIADLERKGYKISRESFLELIRYVNQIGGIIILDYLSQDELKDKIMNHFFEINHIEQKHLVEV